MQVLMEWCNRKLLDTVERRTSVAITNTSGPGGVHYSEMFVVLKPIVVMIR